MIGFQEIYVQSIARAGGIEVPPGVRIFPAPPRPGIWRRGGRALVRGVAILIKAMDRVQKHRLTSPHGVAADTVPPGPSPLPVTVNDDFQAPRAA